MALGVGNKTEKQTCDVTDLGAAGSVSVPGLWGGPFISRSVEPSQKRAEGLVMECKYCQLVPLPPSPTDLGVVSHTLSL